MWWILYYTLLSAVNGFNIHNFVQLIDGNVKFSVVSRWVQKRKVRAAECNVKLMFATDYIKKCC